ncbi:MAG: hypothetical protein ACD_38C00036G0004 [uncultured bacterium]|uniref:Uncharacterized protein n=1 Tax=Candidatus Daviesbacteria bacterium GW2011_GWC2_40_12 TaxID=1618431 RepID=A0A0G0TU38_9BACT|nr:MAG: hypothetical protein ACD_38C00036G0004 [uncultured bacterium]KKQ81663.1 MAG: hypothetical protein UT04_C0067G0012 [Candidatus Daviesbacteria bacterium GW2011_GWF2_38_7]KKR15625.1 MAG: hypothetical protein UT45_C0017G0011 [Candidatus Daviesbacteria bacterium GW2011_GWA2_39_33]KKR24394.1 MAG: hypothetical protein UT54_C0021G0010 [Candidatus Daviesbacteria bacterium GW2011_GWB1_39_5]KKR41407.1 MAG: hypothetical protein UT77_C0012G0034 [Candidatus Daviesbacteria bacterium GW2011_GWC2_40_12]
MKKEISKFYQTYKLFIFPSAVALSSLFLIAFAIIPQTIKLMDNQKAAQEYMNKSNLLEAKAQTLEDYNGEDLSQKIQIVMGALPEDKDFGSILGILQQATAESGYIISSISFGHAGKLGNAESYEVRLTVKGAKDLLKLLINNLENAPRLVRINSMDVGSVQSAGGADISLILEVLYSRLPSALGSIDSALPSLTQKDEEVLNTLERISQKAPTTSSSFVQSPRGKTNPFE